MCVATAMQPASFGMPLVLRPPPGLPFFQAMADTALSDEASAPFCAGALVQTQVGLSVDADGIARLVRQESPLRARSPLRQREVASEIPATQRKRPSPRASPSPPLRPPSPSFSSAAIVYNGTDGKTLAEHIRAAVASGAARIVVDVTGDCVEPDPIEIEAGEILLRGTSDDGARVRLTVTGLRVTGGTLHVQNLLICAVEENRVQSGQLQGSNCLITSRGGCGILCLQRARVFLTDCEVSNCMRSGIGVNGKNTEIELHRCAVSQNNFSGIGVNHQARSITLSQTRVVDNGYHGVWLNTGVVVKWLGGEITGNRLSPKDGPGLLQGWEEGAAK